MKFETIRRYDEIMFAFCKLSNLKMTIVKLFGSNRENVHFIYNSLLKNEGGLITINIRNIFSEYEWTDLKSDPNYNVLCKDPKYREMYQINTIPGNLLLYNE